MNNIRIRLQEQKTPYDTILTLSVEHRDQRMEAATSTQWVPVLRSQNRVEERVRRQLKIGEFKEFMSEQLGKKLLDDLDELICNLEALRYHVKYGGEFKIEWDNQHE